MRADSRIIRSGLVRGAIVAMLGLCAGCFDSTPEYGREQVKRLGLPHRQVWAVAPVVNLSGENTVDPILQADMLFEQLQQVQGLTAVPVNVTAQAYLDLRIQQVASAEQAAVVCDRLGVDGLIVASVTRFDPYNPPKMGSTLTLFMRPAQRRAADVDPRELARRATPPEGTQAAPAGEQMIQVVGMFDAANGSVRDRVKYYAAGRHDPLGPLGEKEYFVNMDRYCGFVYSELVEQLLASPKLKGL